MKTPQNRKKKRKQKLLTASSSSESNNSSITKLNWINTFGKKRLIDKFYGGDYENENAQVTENNNSNDKESDMDVSFFLVKILVMNGYLKTMKLNVSFRSSQQEMFYKNKCSAKTCSGISVSALTVKNLEKYV